MRIKSFKGDQRVSRGSRLRAQATVSIEHEANLRFGDLGMGGFRVFEETAEWRVPQGGTSEGAGCALYGMVFGSALVLITGFVVFVAHCNFYCCVKSLQSIHFNVFNS